MMPHPLYDAHVHLADERFKHSLPEVLDSYQGINLDKAIIIGTSPKDWPAVVEMSQKDNRFIPAVGLHPWEVNRASETWQALLIEFLERGIKVIGEIGLDQWIDGHDIKRQQKAFIWQMSLAAERNLPTSIHCLKAHEPLLKTLRSMKLPERGFKLHAYSGPVETMKPLLDLGAHFSFNAGQLKPNAKKAPELIQQVPDDRLLIETDAPNFLPPEEHREFAMEEPDLCHPGNIRAAYQAIAELRGQPLPSLAAQVSENFQRYFMLHDT
ncbi:TatD family hydrolase [Coraliomargarita sinensis]|nr:TatD family hydrolase [Coraliomargarita sinensis]